MTEGELGCCGARGEIEFEVDVRDVAHSGPGADAEGVADLPVRVTLGDEAQNLSLARCEHRARGESRLVDPSSSRHREGFVHGVQGRERPPVRFGGSEVHLAKSSVVCIMP